MSANPKKCFYLSSGPIASLDAYGVHTELMTYLGAGISLDKNLAQESLYTKLKTRAKKIHSVTEKLPMGPKKQIASTMKSLLAFCTVPQLMSGEL